MAANTIGVLSNSQRSSADQSLISAIGTEFLKIRELKSLAALLGIAPTSVRFNFQEAQQLSGRTVGMPEDYLARVIALYNFVLTMDYLLAHIRALSAQVAQLDQSADPADIQNYFDKQILPPDYIPWNYEYLSGQARKDKSLAVRLTALIGAGSIPAGNMPGTLQDQKDAQERILMSYPLVNCLIAIDKGNYLTFISEATGQIRNQAEWKQLPNGLPTLAVFNAAGAGAAYGPWEAADQGAWGDDTPQPGMQDAATRWPVTCGAIAKAYRLSNGANHMNRLYFMLQQQYESARKRSYLNRGAGTVGFAEGMSRGAMFAEPLKCPGGSIPKYVDYDGNYLTGAEPFTFIDGVPYVNYSTVDVRQSGCQPATRAVGRMQAKRKHKTTKKTKKTKRPKKLTAKHRKARARASVMPNPTDQVGYSRDGKKVRSPSSLGFTARAKHRRRRSMKSRAMKLDMNKQPFSAMVWKKAAQQARLKRRHRRS